MTFLSLETSVESSQPVELYEFTYQGITQYFTSSDSIVTIGPINYIPTQIARSEILNSGEIGKNNLTLNCPDQFTISELFGAGPPEDIVTLVVKRVQYADLDVTQVEIIWIGRITAVSWPPLRSEITCESVFTSLRQAGVRRTYSVNCTFALYGLECTVNLLAFTTTVTVDNQVGNILNGAAFASKPNGWWAGGRIIWQNSPGLYVKRGIKNHSGSQIEITFAMPNFPNGTAVQIAPGCDHSFATCQSKFANGLNYGGYPYMMNKNPWGNASVF
jgi:uncharacterized phage protein (TIGR02218 family)